MKKSWARKLLGGLSFTTALFVFQACYGTPQDYGFDKYIEGTVKSKTTGQPIKGIRVTKFGWDAMNNTYEYTDETGYFSLYSEKGASVKLKFDDVDADANGNYSYKDTVLNDVSDKIYLNIYLENR